MSIGGLLGPILAGLTGYAEQQKQAEKSRLLNAELAKMQAEQEALGLIGSANFDRLGGGARSPLSGLAGIGGNTRGPQFQPTQTPPTLTAPPPAAARPQAPQLPTQAEEAAVESRMDANAPTYTPGRGYGMSTQTQPIEPPQVSGTGSPVSREQLSGEGDQRYSGIAPPEVVQQTAAMSGQYGVAEGEGGEYEIGGVPLKEFLGKHVSLGEIQDAIRSSKPNASPAAVGQATIKLYDMLNRGYSQDRLAGATLLSYLMKDKGLQVRQNEGAANRDVRVRGQDITSADRTRGQDISSADRAAGRGVQIRGQDINSADRAAGRDLRANEGAANRDVRTRGQDLGHEDRTSAEAGRNTRSGNAEAGRESRFTRRMDEGRFREAVKRGDAKQKAELSELHRQIGEYDRQVQQAITNADKPSPELVKRRDAAIERERVLAEKLLGGPQPGQ